MDANKLVDLARENGLVFRGGFSVTKEDCVPAQASGELSKTLLLFGQAGSTLWPVFSASAEYSDGQAHPLNRWSERVGQSIASKLGGTLLLPFGQAPHHPFIRWASRAEGIQSSRLGMLIHPEYGLWHAYRFAIALAEPAEGLSIAKTQYNICNKCQSQPCLKQCPVDAFDGNHYDVNACFHYLQANPESTCHSFGCRARNACPEGSHSHYALEQKQFHMKQFTQALRNP